MACFWQIVACHLNPTELEKLAPSIPVSDIMFSYTYSQRDNCYAPGGKRAPQDATVRAQIGPCSRTGESAMTNRSTSSWPTSAGLDPDCVSTRPCARAGCHLISPLWSISRDVTKSARGLGPNPLACVGIARVIQLQVHYGDLRRAPSGMQLGLNCAPAEASERL
jgi:hypothetical protein